jgi:GTPase SAR1 family protein
MDDKPELAGLQTEEQRRILDAIAKIRKCGLEGVLSLPQIVVCGDQSSGKSSVMEALTGIPFPRNDSRCTRFATEISLRQENEQKLTVKVIPDSDRPLDVQEKIAKFSQSITDFAELPGVITAAMEVMGIANTGGASDRAFAKDTLSVHLEGPDQPHVTLVDIPGLISSRTKGVSDSDIAIVAEITERYISQPRTICLAVVQATNDVANQSILQKVRDFDPKGERSLGVVTKIDLLPVGSDTEASFLELAKNEDVSFKLGWHVVKNRTFEERQHSLEERNSSEREFFEGSVFGQLPKDNIGIDALRSRLSRLLLDHVKTELPGLRKEAETALQKVNNEMSLLGDPRASMEECRSYLLDFSMTCYEICKAGVHGNYENQYFQYTSDTAFSLDSECAVARLRAFVQHFNSSFSEKLRTQGHKYAIKQQESPANLVHEDESGRRETGSEQKISRVEEHPIMLSKADAREWVRRILLRSRGKELIGNFNPHLLNELFWEQSERWEKLATDHVENIYYLCELFLAGILLKKAPRDMKDRFWYAENH